MLLIDKWLRTFSLRICFSFDSYNGVRDFWDTLYKDATKAVIEMNGRNTGTEPPYVALAQRKEDRKAHLTSQYMQKMVSTRMQQMGQIFQPGDAGGYFVPTKIYYNNTLRPIGVEHK